MFFQKLNNKFAFLFAGKTKTFVVGGFVACALCLFAGFLLAGRFAKADPDPNHALTAEVLSASFSEVAASIEPAVVNIDIKGRVPDVTVKEDVPNSQIPNELREFLERQRKPTFAVGSGFIVDKSGLILTNAHVVDGSSRISVRLQNGEEFLASIVGTDEETDLAVLKISAGSDLPTIRFGDSEAIQVGDWVLAVGSPLGLAQTVTAGIISQTRRQTPYSSPFQRFIQTDAAINRGNSGGPLVNMRGEVIGINSQIATSVGEYTGIGFAFPSNEASIVFRQIISYGHVRRGYLGVNLETAKPEFTKVYGINQQGAAIISDIRDKNGPAASAGLMIGDVIISINDQKVSNAQELISRVAMTEPAQNVTLAYFREVGERLESRKAVVKLGLRPTEHLAAEGNPESKKLTIGNANKIVKPLGLVVSELTKQVAFEKKFEGKNGVLVKEIDPTGALFDVRNEDGSSAIYVGDLIQRVNRENVTDVKSFEMAVSKLKLGDAVVLHVAFFNPQSQKVQTKLVQFWLR